MKKILIIIVALTLLLTVATISVVAHGTNPPGPVDHTNNPPVPSTDHTNNPPYKDHTVQEDRADP